MIIVKLDYTAKSTQKDYSIYFKGNQVDCGKFIVTCERLALSKRIDWIESDSIPKFEKQYNKAPFKVYEPYFEDVVNVIKKIEALPVE